MTALLAALAGAALVAGLVLVVAGVTVVDDDARPQRNDRRRFQRQASVRRTSGSGALSRPRIALAVGAGAVAWLLTGWPVAGLIVALTVWGLPIVLSTSRVAAAGIDRVEALEEWTRRLSDVLVVGVGLEQAITATVRTCPAPIESEVSALAARIAARWPTEDALRAFADDLDDATGDLVCAALILGAAKRGDGLARVLQDLAESVAADVRGRRQIEADRAKPRASARMVTLLSIGALVFFGLGGRFFAPYSTPLGQLILLVLLSCYGLLLWWLRRMAEIQPATRILGSQLRGRVGRR